MDTTTGTSTSTSTSTGATSGSLPATGSELPLVGLIGLSALAGAVALRASRS
jgi:LPXTG-motif cell wall-anchored protein